MRIVGLLENSCKEGLACAHGLSIYAETAKHKILFDAGPSGELLLSNAEKMDIDLRDVDIAILSHAHYDHAGGLCAFMEINKKAKLYIHNLAASRGHFATENVGWRNIGLDDLIMKNHKDRIILTGDSLEIDSGLTLFSDIFSADFISESNNSLFEKIDGTYVPDSFKHEQNLLIQQEGKIYLLAGCAHRGIINILRRAEEIAGATPDYVFSGFHLTNPGLKLDMPEDFVRSVGRELKKYSCAYYTGHCTGINPYSWLKNELESKLNYLCGGLDITF